MADIDVLTEQLCLFIANPAAFPGDEGQKSKVMQLSRQAAASLESPFETLQRLVYSAVHATTASNWLPWLQAAGLLESGVLEAVLDCICIQGMAMQVARGHYVATKLTHMLLVPVFVDAVTHFNFTALHRALTEGEGKQNAFKLRQNMTEPFYTRVDTRPVQRDAFHHFMDAQFANLPTWLDVVDFEAEMASDVRAEDIVFVDVGGGNGSQLAALRKVCPDVKGGMILQDQAYVLERAMEVHSMEKMAYDFLTEQPVKGARVYYFRQIIHNLDDETCIRILKAQLPALAPNSVIVLDDKALPDEKPPPGTPGVEYTAAPSIAMKVIFDAQERREAHWQRLLDAAGLEIREIRKFTKFDDAVVIAVEKSDA